MVLFGFAGRKYVRSASMIYAPSSVRAKLRELREAAGVGQPVRYRKPKRLVQIMRTVSTRLKKAHGR